MQPTETIIFEGELEQNGLFNRWKSRYVYLCTTRMLNIYENKEQSKRLTYINLSNVIAIHRRNQSTIETNNPLKKQSLSLSLNKKTNKLSLSFTQKINKNENKFMFEIITTTKKYMFATLSEDSMDQWIKHLNVYIYGDIIHSGYMQRQTNTLKTWEHTWFTLSSHWKELRYYQRKNVTNSFKGKIDLSNTKLLKYGNKNKYGFDYSIQLITDIKSFVFINQNYNEQIQWFEQIENVLKGQHVCCCCNEIYSFDNIQKNNIYYKINVTHKGQLYLFNINTFEWIANYYAIDKKTMRLFYTNTIEQMNIFENCLIEHECVETYINEIINGYYLLIGEKIEMLNDIKETEYYSTHYCDIKKHIFDVPEEKVPEKEPEMGQFVTDESVDLMYPTVKSMSDLKIKEGTIDENETINSPMSGHGRLRAESNVSIVSLGDDMNVNINLENEMDPFIKAFYKYKYKFVIGNDIFAVDTYDTAKKWINELKNAIDITKRDIDDEKNYLCFNHLNIFISGYCNRIIICDDNRKICIPDSAYKYILMCLSCECFDNANLITF